MVELKRKTYFYINLFLFFGTVFSLQIEKFGRKIEFSGNSQVVLFLR